MLLVATRRVCRFSGDFGLGFRCLLDCVVVIDCGLGVWVDRFVYGYCGGWLVW